MIITVGIYKITNKLNGKSYIGQSVNLERRFKEHFNTKLLSEFSLLHTSMLVDGIDNFSFEVVDICDVNDLNDKEITYIQKCNTLYPHGYNVSRGGHCGHLNKLVSYQNIDGITYLLNNTDLSNFEIGKLYNVSDQTISDINTGRIWKRDNITYPIRNRKIINRKFCDICGKELYKYTSGSLCSKCIKSKQRSTLKLPPISKNELYNLLCHTSFEAVGRDYHVSGNTVKKWCDKYNIPRHAKYYKNLKPS